MRQQLKEQADDESIIQEGVRAVDELKHKVCLHKSHVDGKLKTVQEALAQHEQDAASLAATMQALDGKIVEAEDQAGEADEKALACKTDWVSVWRAGAGGGDEAAGGDSSSAPRRVVGVRWVRMSSLSCVVGAVGLGAKPPAATAQESKDLDWKGRKKEWSQKLKKEQRNSVALEESRVVIKEELDEVVSQLAEQRHSALNHKSMLMSVKGEKQAVDSLITQSEVCVYLTPVRRASAQGSM